MNKDLEGKVLRVESPIRIENDEFIDNLMNTINDLVKLLNIYDEIDFSKVKNCKVKRIVRIPKNDDVKYDVDNEKMIISENNENENFKICMIVENNNEKCC